MSSLRTMVRHQQRRFFRLLQFLTLPGGITLYAIWSLSRSHLHKVALNLSAAAMAFNFFLALFPTLIFIFSLAPFIPMDDLIGTVYEYLQQALPPSVYYLVKSTLDEILLNKSVGLISISILVVMYSANRGLTATIKTFESIDVAMLDFKPKPNLLRLYGRSFGLFFILFLLFIVGSAASIIGDLVFHNFLEIVEQYTVIDTAPVKTGFHVLLLLLAILGVSILYRIGAAHPLHRRFFSKGSILAGVLVYLTQLVLKFLFINFINYSNFYGSLASVIALMVWMYWISFSILVGYLADCFWFNLKHQSGTMQKEEP